MLNSTKKEVVKVSLSHIFTDMLSLMDGEWEPDYHSINATLKSLEIAAETLDIVLVDYRS